ncbi:MAG: transglutaminase-like domain-containing protein [Thermoplasmata archaeon]
MQSTIEFLAYPLPAEIKQAISDGNYKLAKKRITNYLELKIPQDMEDRLKYELNRMAQIKSIYLYTEKKAKIILKKKLSNFRIADFKDWFDDGYLDHVYLNGKYLYFSRFFDNLLFLNPALSGQKIVKTKKAEQANNLLNVRIDKIKMGEVLKYRITAGIRISLKNAELYRVWLPIPLDDGIIDNVKILKTEPEHTEISNNSAQNTIYFESIAANFYVEFQYDISEFSLNEKNSYYRKNQKFNIADMLTEKYPHVIFTPYLKKLTENIVLNEQDPFKKAKKIYDWITENVRYTYVPDYFLFDNISEYTATSLRGDCGMMSLLLITMSRIAGIPAKWQSGWYITPYNTTLHDWTQLYIEPYGWIPVDPSFGNIIKNKNEKRRNFYFGNLDAFRMIANEDYQVDFDPPKKYWRSDPVDNQRGEVETEFENVYPDKFKYKILIKKFEILH